MTFARNGNATAATSTPARSALNIEILLRPDRQQQQSVMPGQQEAAPGTGQEAAAGQPRPRRQQRRRCRRGGRGRGKGRQWRSVTRGDIYPEEANSMLRTWNDALRALPSEATQRQEEAAFQEGRRPLQPQQQCYDEWSAEQAIKRRAATGERRAAIAERREAARSSDLPAHEEEQDPPCASCDSISSYRRLNRNRREERHAARCASQEEEISQKEDQRVHLPNLQGAPKPQQSPSSGAASTSPTYAPSPSMEGDWAAEVDDTYPLNGDGDGRPEEGEWKTVKRQGRLAGGLQNVPAHRHGASAPVPRPKKKTTWKTLDMRPTPTKKEWPEPQCACEDCKARPGDPKGHWIHDSTNILPSHHSIRCSCSECTTYGETEESRKVPPRFVRYECYKSLHDETLRCDCIKHRPITDDDNLNTPGRIQVDWQCYVQAREVPCDCSNCRPITAEDPIDHPGRGFIKIACHLQQLRTRAGQ